MKKFATLFLLFGVFFTACEENTLGEEPERTEGLVMVGSGHDNGIKIQTFIDEDIIAGDSLIVGYNRLYFLVQDNVSDEDWTMAHIRMKPEMNMMGQMHGCPYKNPDMTPDEKGFFVGEIIPVMGSSDMSVWSLDLDIKNHAGDDSAHLSFTYYVKDTGNRQIFYDATDDSATLYAMLVLPKPTVGTQEIGFTIHEKENESYWLSRDDFTIEMEPWMSSMGHGSLGNVNPVHAANGYYGGKINFSMTGDWEIRLTFMRNGTAVGNATYGVMLQ